MRRHPTRVLVAILLAFGLVATAPGTAFAQDDNVAVVENTTDGLALFDLAFSIVQVAGSVVDQTNVAVAYSSCEECRSVAIAIQIVLVQSDDVDVVEPENVAVAVNEECISCETLATAHQIVIGRGGPVRLTGEGRREIAEIRRELRALQDSDDDIAEIEQAVSDLVDDLRQVLEDELVPIGRPDGRGRPDASSSASETVGPSESASPSASPTSSASPTGSLTPVDPDPEATTQDDPSASPSPESS